MCGKYLHHESANCTEPPEGQQELFSGTILHLVKGHKGDSGSGVPTQEISSIRLWISGFLVNLNWFIIEMFLSKGKKMNEATGNSSTVTQI